MLKPKKKNPAAVALSKLGASKGGIARAKKLSPKQRSRIAKLAVEARWAKYHGDK
jgi:ABC-type phosphate/phosphonate transport system ATPase subunit